MSSDNTQGGKDNGNLFRRKIKSDSVKKALKMCDMDSNPNIYVLLKIRGTVAVTALQIGETPKSLKRLNSYF